MNAHTRSSHETAGDEGRLREAFAYAHGRIEAQLEGFANSLGIPARVFTQRMAAALAASAGGQSVGASDQVSLPTLQFQLEEGAPGSTVEGNGHAPRGSRLKQGKKKVDGRVWISPEEQETILRLRKEGRTFAAIAEIVGRPHHSVSNLVYRLHKHGARSWGNMNKAERSVEMRRRQALGRQRWLERQTKAGKTEGRV